jgi:hypothetical protein
MSDAKSNNNSSEIVTNSEKNNVSLLEWALLCLHVVDASVALGLALPLVDYAFADLFAAESSFSHATVDLMWLAFARLVVVPTAVLWRARRARRNRAESEVRARQTVYVGENINERNDDFDGDDDNNSAAERSPLLVEPDHGSSINNGDDAKSKKKAMRKARQVRQRLLSDRARKQVSHRAILTVVSSVSRRSHASRARRRFVATRARATKPNSPTGPTQSVPLCL